MRGTKRKGRKGMKEVMEAELEHRKRKELKSTHPVFFPFCEGCSSHRAISLREALSSTS